MARRLYEVLPEGQPVTMADLAGALNATVPTTGLQNPLWPEGAWECENPDCQVRKCVIYSKAYGERMPRMRCPACGTPLAFRDAIESVTLVPCPTPPPGGAG